MKAMSEAMTEGFQFTTSQGGRPAHLDLPLMRVSFNSRPHKEVDPDFFCIACPEIVFQFTTSQGGRRQLERRGY